MEHQFLLQLNRLISLTGEQVVGGRGGGGGGVLAEGVDMSSTLVYPETSSSVEGGSGLVGSMSVSYIYCIKCFSVTCIYGSFKCCD